VVGPVLDSADALRKRWRELRTMLRFAEPKSLAADARQATDVAIRF
jgi:hypothetical protein